MERWDGMFATGLRAHLLTAGYGPAADAVRPEREDCGDLPRRSTMGREYLGNVFYDVARSRLAEAAEVLAGS